MPENESDHFEALGLDAPEETAAGPETQADASEPAEDLSPQDDEAGRRADFERAVASELEEIRRYDPSIRTAADLMRLDRRDAFIDAVRRHNHTFAEAYRYVYADRITEAAVRNAARQAAERTRLNELGKRHMRQTGAHGTGDVAVPAAVEKNVRAIMPKATAKDIREYYRKYIRQVR